MREPVRHRARVPVAVAGLVVAFAAAGCDGHRVASSYPCTATKTHVVVSDTGAVALARVGITPARLKAQQTCRE
jgi:hypothetical protein